MKKLFFSVSALAVLFFSSCKKNDDNDGNGGVAPGTRLLKTVVKSGSDSTVSTYTYNSAGKLIANAVSGSSGGQPIDVRTTMVRNSAGIIQKQILKSDAFAGFIDSLVTNIGYDAANGRYKNAVTVVSVFGFTLSDSIVYNYDASGKVVSQIEYLDDGSGTGYVPDNKIEFSYAGNNLQTQKYYTYDPTTSTYTLDETTTLEYDAKTSPLQFTNEAPVLGMTQFFSANNVVKNTFVSVSSPADNRVTNVTYTYNDAGRPATASEVTGTTTSTGTFTYQ